MDASICIHIGPKIVEFLHLLVFFFIYGINIFTFPHYLHNSTWRPV